MSGTSRVAAVALAAGLISGCLQATSADRLFPTSAPVDMVVCLRPGTDSQALIDGPVLSRPTASNVPEGSQPPPGVAAIRADPARTAIDIKLDAARGATDADNLRAALEKLPQVRQVQAGIVRRDSCPP